MTTDDRRSSPERNARLDAAWRAHSTELPPPAIDAAILAAAHREVASRPRAAGDDDTLAEAREPSRWWWGLAAAATIGAIAFGLVQLASPDTVQDPTRASDMPPDARVAQAAAPPAAAAVESPLRAKPETAAAPASGLARIETPKTTPAPVPRPAPPPRVMQPRAESAAERHAAGPQATEVPALESRRDDAAPPRPFPMQAAPAPPPAAESVRKQESPAPASRERIAEPMAKRAAPAALAADAAPSVASGASAEGRTAAPASPEAFVRRIREHYDAGRLDAAARELHAFREAFADADARLPQELRAWAASIRN